MDILNNRPPLVGQFDVSVDASGSFDFPEEWRFWVTDGGEMCFVPHPHENCLLLLPKDTLDDQVELLKRSHEPDALTMLDRIIGNVHAAVIDGDGRMTIPPVLRARVGITSAASMIGCVRVVEVWSR